MEPPEIRALLEGFDEDVVLISGADHLEPHERAQIPTWWQSVADSPGRDAARRASEEMKKVGDGCLDNLRHVLARFGSAYLVRTGKDTASNIAIVYHLENVDLRGGNSDSATWLAPCPRMLEPGALSLGAGGAAAALRRFYGILHDGFDVRPTIGRARLLPQRSVISWDEFSYQEDEDIECEFSPPYRPRASDLMVVWEEATAGMTIMIDRSCGAVWGQASGLMTYCSVASQQVSVVSDSQFLFGKIEERILGNLLPEQWR